MRPSTPRAKQTRRSVRNLARKFHHYIALTVGFMFVFSGLTGSTLVFYKEIDAFLNPTLLTVQPAGEHAPFTAIVTAARSVAPLAAIPTRVYFPAHPQQPMKVRFSVPRAGQDGQLDVLVNPFTTEVLGQRYWGGYLVSFLYQLHHTLLAGDIGETIVGVIGLMLLGVTVAGLVAWWPSFTNLVQAFKVRRGGSRTRFLYDLHKMLGALVAIFLLVIAFSGLYMVFPNYVRPLISWGLPMSERSGVGVVERSDNGSVIGISAVATLAKQRFPQAVLQRIYFPVSTNEVYRVIMRQAGEVRKTSASTQLWIDAYSGSVLAVQEPKTMSSGEVFIAWLFPLHNGEAFGLPGRAMVFLMGYAPCILYVTGMLVWWRKRKALAQRNHRNCRC